MFSADAEVINVVIRQREMNINLLRCLIFVFIFILNIFAVDAKKSMG